MTGREPVVAYVALAAPAIVWLAVAAAILVASLAGYRALAAPVALTLAEAAAIRDEAEVLKQIRAGADPNPRTVVRRGIAGDPEYLLTPLEAAVAARHVPLVELLVRNGAALDALNARVLVCLAEAKDAADIVVFLKAHAPPDVSWACEDVRLPL